MTEPRYAYKPGAHVNGVAAETAGVILSAIEERDGTIRPAIVVDEARPAESPLHPAFLWDDTEAAERFRRDQARLLIRSVVVVPEQTERPTTAMRAFVQVSLTGGEAAEEDDQEPDRVYIGTERAMGDPNLRAQVLARALSELSALARKYREFRELAEVFAAIDRAAASVAA